MKLCFAFLLALTAALLPWEAYAECTNANDCALATDNGVYLNKVCLSASGRVSVYDGGEGFDSGSVVFQYQTSHGDWESVSGVGLTTWTGDDTHSGATPFNLGIGGTVRFLVSGVAGASADIKLEALCF